MNPIHATLDQMYRRGQSLVPDGLRQDARAGGEAPLRAAAVLIAVTQRAEPGVLLLHRPSHMRAHPGQVAFPGGRLDPGETPTAAALREAHEELGIDTSRVQVIGAVDRYRTHSGYDITPILATMPADLPIQPNPAEVAQWFEAPLAHVLAPANQIERWITRDGAAHPIIEIVWQEHRIWGVTAAILFNLARRLNWGG